MIGNGVVVNLPTLFFTNKTFGYRINCSKKYCNPKEGTPNQWSNQILAQVKGEVAYKGGAKKIKH
jgi:hypothetical protein